MPDLKRRVGIDIIGEASWGTHFCLFYQTPKQLIEILAPYLQAGVENNEYCVWMVAEPLTKITARQTLREAAQQLTPYLKKRQIEILDRSPWLLKNGDFNPQAMLEGWAEMERQALEKGFDGLRIFGDMGWIGEDDWEMVNYYEGQVDRETGKRHILALCAFAQEKCGISTIFDLISQHQFGLIQRSGKWEMIASSEYGQVKEELKASQDRYQALVNSAHHHLFMLDREGKYLASNRRVSQFGLENGEALIGLCLDDVFTIELAETYIQQMEQVLATGLEVEFEYPMATPDGEREYLVALYPIFHYGEIEAVGGISRDITGTRLAEKAALQAEARYRSIYENAVEGIFQSTPEGRFLNVNPAMAHIFGYASPEEMLTAIGSNIENRIYVDSDRRDDFRRALSAEGVVTKFENQNYRKDGSIIWSHTNARAVYDEKGNLAYYEGFLTDVTERKQAEEALAHARDELELRVQQRTVELFSANQELQAEVAERKRAQEQVDFQAYLLENVNDAIIASDENYILTAWNSSAERLYGWKAEEVIGRFGLEVTQTQFLTGEGDEMRRLIAESGKWQGEATQVCKDGRRFPVEVSTIVLRDPNGAVTGYVSVNRDISERVKAAEQLHRAHDELEKHVKERTTELAMANASLHQEILERSLLEDALRESEQRFHSLFNNATVGLYRTTPDGQIQLSNPAIVEMLGYGSFDEMASRNLEQDGFEPEYQRDQFRQKIETDGEVRGLESIWNRKDGKRIYVRESAVAVRASDGRILYYEGTVEDITERKQAEEALRESEIRFRTLASVASAGIYLTDAQGNCLYVNPRWCQMTGVQQRKALGQSWAISIHPEDVGWMKDEMAKAQGESGEWNYEYRMLKPDGTVTWVSGVAAPIFDQSGRNPNPITGYVGVALDITERKQMETQLRTALAEKEVLLREVHHRVKNNLATISSLLELQARASQDTRIQNAFLESQQRIRSMAQIHEQLYRSESLSTIDMSQYVTGMADELRYIYSKGEIAVQADVRQVKLTIDQAIPCGLIINELITNGLKYAFPTSQAESGASRFMADNPDRRQVRVSLHAEGERCRLKVSDNGIGLPVEFDIQSTRTLGLRLVTRLAVQLGGELEVEAGSHTEGSGAAFQIVFPMRK